MKHRDRLTRFDLEHLEAALGDVTEVPASMRARPYGQRAAKNRAARGLAVVTG